MCACVGVGVGELSIWGLRVAAAEVAAAATSSASEAASSVAVARLTANGMRGRRVGGRLPTVSAHVLPQ